MQTIRSRIDDISMSREVLAAATVESERRIALLRGLAYGILLPVSLLNAASTGVSAAVGMTLNVVGLMSTAVQLWAMRRGGCPNFYRYASSTIDVCFTFFICRASAAALSVRQEGDLFAWFVAMMILIVAVQGARLDWLLLGYVTAVACGALWAYVLYQPGEGSSRYFHFVPVVMAAVLAAVLIRTTQRAAERDALGRFLPESVQRRIIRDPLGLKLGGELVECSVMFTDLRGFTSLSERLPPQQVMDLLNQLHAVQVGTVESFGGIVNKFTGDGMLAVFGAPNKLTDHRRAAAEAAITIVKEVRARFGGGDHPVALGAGVHSGNLVAGNVGAQSQLEFTVIGDVVNVAARLESLTRELRCDVIISDDVQRSAGDLGFAPGGMHKVKGKSEPLNVYLWRA